MMNRIRRLLSARVRRAAGVVSFVIAGAAATTALSQPAQPPNGPRRTDPAWHALVNATLVPEPGKKIENATIVFKDGVIRSVEAGAQPPAGARVWDCAGLTVYPGLVEPALIVDAPRPDEKAPGTHWNRNVMAQRSALEGVGVDADTRKKLRAQGYVAAGISPKGGIFRGVGAVVSLSEQGPSSDPLAGVISPRAFHALSLDVNRTDDRGYPNSKMGAIALVRQLLADSPWHAKAQAAYKADPAASERPAPDNTAEALAEPLPLFFDVDNELDVLRAAKIAKEFERPLVVIGSGSEYKRLAAIAETRTPLIVPLAFADKPEVSTLADRENVDLRQLMSWEASPTNAARLMKAGVEAALTSGKLPKDQKFDANLREAIKAGLSEDQALAMLTQAPAKVLGVSNKLGRVAPGMNASLVIVKGSLFDEERQVRDVWIDGVRHEVNPAPRVELEGSWAASFTVPGRAEPVAGVLKITKKNEITFERPASDADREREAKEKAGKDAEKPADANAAAPAADQKKPDEPAKDDTRSFKARSVQLDENRVDFVLDGAALFAEQNLLLNAVVESTMIGGGTMPGGEGLSWTASRGEKKDDEKKEPKEEDAQRYEGVPESFGLPFGPFAFDAIPPQQTLLITGATIWTSGEAGIIENGTMLVSGGKIRAVFGGNASADVAIPADSVRLDAKGKHITPGLIDCHSHTGISGGVNEGTQSCTAEVRIFDVIDPDAIGWYRELAGGLTAVNQLHGSANSIGGQNSVVKLRWGVQRPDDMRVEGAIAGIKFALGENVKQSNWGEQFRDRYPQTRMGVETYIRDRFTAAREYDQAWQRWNASSQSARSSSVPPRRDLELEALAEILRGERLVHCHSYRQDEILMLCRVAQDFGFKIGTFQHVLEGYKVAEAIRAHAIGGSAFSDWWAYKYEVVDAIPYAGAIMHNAGVVVSFNSDSDELARRMNTEAAKAVKYGGVPRAEALKFVTLNPAKQLKIDDRTGSLEAGKDADFVIWSGDPLSTLSRCEATFVDGREMFSLTRDAQLRAAAKAQRERIIQKLLSKPKKADKPEEPKPKAKAPEVADEPPTLDDLRASGRGAWFAPVGESLEEARERAAKLALERHYLWMVTNGLDPLLSHAGDCGCSAACMFQN